MTNRLATLLVAVAVVAAGLGSVPLSGLAASGLGDGSVAAQSSPDGAGNESDLPPGALFSGSVGVQEAELGGEVATRSFGLQAAAAATNASKAGVVAASVADIQTRLTDLQQQKAALQRAHENGNISDAAYKVKIAELAARTETVRALANQTEAVAAGLPADLLERKGINVAAIQTLKQDAKELSGGEVAEIARSIAGGGPGASVAEAARPDGAGPPADRGAGRGAAGDTADAANPSEAIDEAEQQIEAARERIAKAERQLGPNASENATEALEAARQRLQDAEDALDEARAASDAGDDQRAVRLAEQAREHAEAALDQADAAIDAAASGPGNGDGGDGFGYGLDSA